MTNDHNNKFDQLQKSEELQHIIERMPRKFASIVLLLILVITILLTIFGWVIKYPDIITARVTLNTKQAPIKLVAPNSGKLLLTRFRSKDVVKSGDVIAWIENSASLTEVEKIDSLIQRFPINDKEKIVQWSKLLPENISLGELSTKYYTFLNAIKLFVDYNTNELYNKQIQGLKNLLHQQQNVLLTTINMSDITHENLIIINKFQLRDSLLHKKEVISDADLDRTRLQTINARSQYQSSIKEITLSNEKIKQSEKAIQELIIEKSEKEQQLNLAISKSFNELNDALSYWKKQYLFVAPFTGKVQFLNFWADKQFVQAGNPIFTIIPNNESITGEVMLPSYGAGKVQLEQDVIVKLDNYPYMEYGSISGKVESISLTTNNVESAEGMKDFYLVRISFPKKFETTFKSDILYKYGMKGTVEIVTNDRRLIERFFDNLRIKR